MNADNAISNDMQGESLAGMPNSFELKNHVHCFNHTLQLSAKTLLHPFNVGLGKTNEDHNSNNIEDLLDEDIDECNEDDEDSGENKDSLPIIPEGDNFDDGVDEFDTLEMDEHEEIMVDTAAVCETITKVCVSFIGL